MTFATYVGYWLAGAMLIAIGMVASQLTSNVTVAFIVGAALSAIPVFPSLIAPLLIGGWADSWVLRVIEDLSLPEQMHDFGTGLLPFSGVFYFLSAAAAVLYINVLLLGRRHWAGGERSAGHWTHSIARAAAVVVAVASLNVLVGRTGVQADVSEERLHTLSPDSIKLLGQIPKDRPVYVQAYYSPEVPRDLVSVRRIPHGHQHGAPWTAVHGFDEIAQHHFRPATIEAGGEMQDGARAFFVLRRAHVVCRFEKSSVPRTRHCLMVSKTPETVASA